MLPRLTFAVLFIITTFNGFSQYINYCWIWHSYGPPPRFMFQREDHIYGASGPYLMKYDSKGNAIWIKMLPAVVTGMDMDENGSIYAGGKFTGSISVDNTTVTSNGENDIFIAKFSNTGHAEWLKNIGSTGNDTLSALKVDDQKIKLAGTISGTVSLGAYTLTQTNGASFTASMLAENGQVLFANNYHAPGYGHAFNIRLRMDKKGGIYYAGQSYDTLSIGSFVFFPRCKTYMQLSLPFSWFAKIDTTGALVWAKELFPCMNQSFEYYRDFVDFYVDDAGYIYVSDIEGLWPIQWGPNIGDPYSNRISMFTPDGDLAVSGSLTTYGFIGGNSIKRYILHARNQKLLLKNVTVNRLEYIKDIADLDIARNELFYGTANGEVAGIADTIKNVFYFSGAGGLSKLAKGFEITAGPDIYVCTPADRPVRLLGRVACGQVASLKWTPSTGLSSDIIGTPTVNLDQIEDHQTYVLTAMDASSVTKTDTVELFKFRNPDKPIITAENNILYTALLPDMQYQWYNSLFNTSLGNQNSLDFANIREGKYTVIITDKNGCSSISDTFYAYRISANAGADTAVCKGNTVQLGGSPTAYTTAGDLTFEWMPAYGLDSSNSSNPLAKPDTSICYRLIARNSYGNNMTDTVCIQVNPKPAVTITQNGNTLHSGYTTGNQWYFNGQPISNATNENYTIIRSGFYSVRVTDEKGCSTLSQRYYAQVVRLYIVVHPSVVCGREMTVKYQLPEDSRISIDIVNIGTGVKKILVNNVWKQAGQYTMPVNVSRYHRGIYMIRLQTANGIAYDKFIVL